jgi:hypothetical protein
MAWHEQGPSGNYFIGLRIGEKRFRRSLKTNSKDDADSERLSHGAFRCLLQMTPSRQALFRPSASCACEQPCTTKQQSRRFGYAGS